MSGPFQLHQYPVFEEGVFQSNPALFDRFAHFVSPGIRERFRVAWETLPRHEGTVTWPMVIGPGLSAGTHPGADNVFIEVMLGSNSFVYDSDCVYVNPSQRVFAISDPPGISDASRRLFTRLDRRLQEGTAADLEGILNGLHCETSNEDGATLTLLALPENGPAVAFVAGDTYLYHGNLSHRELTVIQGIPEFFGTPHTYLAPIPIQPTAGDFFIIASDGILSIRGNDREKTLAEVLRERVDGDLEGFTLRAIQDSNRCLEESIYDRSVTRFGGSDNVSALLVYPEGLPQAGPRESFILGGYVTRRPA